MGERKREKWDERRRYVTQTTYKNNKPIYKPYYINDSIIGMIKIIKDFGINGLIYYEDYINKHTHITLNNYYTQL